MSLRQLFLQHLAPTSMEPMAISIERALGSRLYGINGKEFIDLIGGISVCNVGHCHPKVVAAIQQQAATYMHVMVYGEVVQRPQVKYAQMLAEKLPETLSNVYFTNSGAEAVEGAMKLAKRATGRTEFVAFQDSYHGSTQGALSLMGSEYWRNSYRPLLPDTRHLRYSNFEDLEQISCRTAAVVVEPIQAEAGVLVPAEAWLSALRQRCTELGALLVFDEIQTGFGRTGKLWGMEHSGVVPDILLLGKALGGGMPLGAFIASQSLMQLLAADPILGHLTTFGGHPVSCVAGAAAFQALQDENMVAGVAERNELFNKKLQHRCINTVTHQGLMLAVHLEDFEQVQKVIAYCLDAENAVFTDWFLFASNCIRLVPPLNISLKEIDIACNTLLMAFNALED